MSLRHRNVAVTALIATALVVTLGTSSVANAAGESSTTSSTTSTTIESTTTTSTILPTPTAAETSLLYPARALRFPEYTRLNPPLLPANSGVGRRVVYQNKLQWVWVVDANNKVRETMPVSGRRGVPKPGEYRVTSQSLRSYSLDFEGVWFVNMTRFAFGPAGGSLASARTLAGSEASSLPPQAARVAPSATRARSGARRRRRCMHPFCRTSPPRGRR